MRYNGTMFSSLKKVRIRSDCSAADNEILNHDSTKTGNVTLKQEKVTKEITTCLV